MIITEISEQKKKGRYNLFIDDAFYSGIDEEVIVINKLKVGQDLTKEQLEEIVVQSEKRRAFEKLIDMISKKMCCEKEIFDKLIKKGFNSDGIRLAIDLAKDYGYIDDLTYAKSFVQSNKNKSVRELKNKLFLKGVKKSIIEEAVSEISSEDENDNAWILAQKYMKNKSFDKKTFANLYNFLARKGFDNAVCMNVIHKFKIDLDD